MYDAIMMDLLYPDAAQAPGRRHRRGPDRRAADVKPSPPAVSWLWATALVGFALGGAALGVSIAAFVRASAPSMVISFGAETRLRVVSEECPFGGIELIQCRDLNRNNRCDRGDLVLSRHILCTNEELAPAMEEITDGRGIIGDRLTAINATLAGRVDAINNTQLVIHAQTRVHGATLVNLDTEKTIMRADVGENTVRIDSVDSALVQESAAWVQSVAALAVAQGTVANRVSVLEGKDLLKSYRINDADAAIGAVSVRLMNSEARIIAIEANATAANEMSIEELSSILALEMRANATELALYASSAAAAARDDTLVALGVNVTGLYARGDASDAAIGVVAAHLEVTDANATHHRAHLDDLVREIQILYQADVTIWGTIGHLQGNATSISTEVTEHHLVLQNTIMSLSHVNQTATATALGLADMSAFVLIKIGEFATAQTQMLVAIHSIGILQTTMDAVLFADAHHALGIDNVTQRILHAEQRLDALSAIGLLANATDQALTDAVTAALSLSNQVSNITSRMAIMEAAHLEDHLELVHDRIVLDALVTASASHADSIGVNDHNITALSIALAALETTTGTSRAVVVDQLYDLFNRTAAASTDVDLARAIADSNAAAVALLNTHYSILDSHVVLLMAAMDAAEAALEHVTENATANAAAVAYATAHIATVETEVARVALESAESQPRLEALEAFRALSEPRLDTMQAGIAHLMHLQWGSNASAVSNEEAIAELEINATVSRLRADANQAAVALAAGRLTVLNASHAVLDAARASADAAIGGAVTRIAALEASLSGYSITVQSKTVMVACASGQVDEIGSAGVIHNAIVVRIAVGRYTVVLQPPMASADYPVLISMDGLSSADSTEYIDAVVTPGTRTSNGFSVEIINHKEKKANKAPRDMPFNFNVMCEQTLVTGVTMTNV